MSNKLTKKQILVLDFIDDFLKNHDYAPSYREIAAELGLSSVSAVAEHIENLVQIGVLKKNPGQARSLEVVELIPKEVIETFKHRLISSTPEEIEILRQAAEILGFDLF